MSVETAKYLCEENQPENKNKLNFPRVNCSESWDLLLNFVLNQKNTKPSPYHHLNIRRKKLIFS